MLLFGAGVAFGLALIFPQKGLEERLARNARADALTVEYLRVFLAAHPDSPRLRMLLARQLVLLERHDEARQALKVLMQTHAGPARLEALVYDFDILEKLAYLHEQGSAAREQALSLAAERLRELAREPLDTPQLAYLAERAVATGDRVTAVRLYARLAARGEVASDKANADAARLVLGLGDYRVAAQLFFRAEERAVGLPRKREHFRDAIATLVAGNHFDEAVGEAEARLDSLGDDAETLRFLTRMAQAANRPDAAQRFVKRLLRMALLRALQERLAHALPLAEPRLEPALYAQGGAFATRVNATAQGPQLPFDDATYLLGFEVFVAAGNLVDAFKVAESAVLQAPGLPEWRRRLAQVAEWRNLPQLALPHWLAHARMTGAAASWEAVLRLAAGLRDDDALQAALEHRLARAPGDLTLIERLVELHERQGKPDAAIELLRARATGGARLALLEKLALLAERAGRDELALQTLATLQAEFGATPERAMRQAGFLYRKRDVRRALAALEAVPPDVAGDNVEFWNMSAELARLLQEDGKAIAAYRRLLAIEKFSEGDLQNLLAILDSSSPKLAAQVAEFAFARHPRIEYVLTTLYQYGRLPDHAAIGRFLARIHGNLLAELQRDARFLLARAAHFQAVGDARRALADYRAAHAADPADAQTRAAILWLLIAARDDAGLRQALRVFMPGAGEHAVLWGPVAAALMSINRQAEALPWFRRQARRHNDYLWMMAYAECLDANMQGEVAWRIRRLVWTELRRAEVLASLAPAEWNALRDRLASLAQVFVPGDRAKAVVEALLRADLKDLVRPAAPAPLPADGAALARLLADTPLESPQVATAGTPAVRHLPQAWFERSGPPARGHPASVNEATVKELALAYALNVDGDELARAWLMTRFANDLARPLWGQLSVALAASDKATLTRLIDDLPDWLPMYDRVEAAMRIGRPALAQTLAFEQLDHLQHDEPLHLRFTTMVTEDPARLAGAVTAIRQSPLAIRQWRGEASADLTPRLKLGLSLTINEQSTQDETALIGVPANDRTATLFARWRLEAGRASLAVFQREALRAFTGVRLDYDLALAPRLRLSGSIGHNVAAPELPILRAGGMKDSIDNSINWNVSSREYLRLGLSLNRYRSQDGIALGHGTLANVEAGHRLRIEYPDFTLRVFAARADFRSASAPDAAIEGLLPAALRTGDNRFLPAGATSWGAAFGWGLSLQDRYTRALRPFFDLSLARNSVTGPVHAVRMGLAGSLIGQDHMSLHFSRASGTPGAPQGLRELGLSYQWLY